MRILKSDKDFSPVLLILVWKYLKNIFRSALLESMDQILEVALSSASKVRKA